MATDVPTDLQAALAERYELTRALGRGGMATVYLAYDRKHRREVALKVLLPGLAAFLGSERFLKEIQIAARLTHPHILALHESGEAAGFLYYVMPYIDGASLRQRIERERRLSAEQALAIAAPVADALSYAHKQGVFHRDIKPENILFSQGHPIVADFGIAKAISTAGGANLTRTGFPLGTPGYMSPEQAAGLTDLDERTDVYSLAVVIYEMLVGEGPGRWPSADHSHGSRPHTRRPGVSRSWCRCALNLPEVLPVIIPLWLATTYATARTAYRSSSRRRLRELEGLAERLAALARELVPERLALRHAGRPPSA